MRSLPFDERPLHSGGSSGGDGPAFTGGPRNRQPIFNAPPAILILAAVVSLVFGLMQVVPNGLRHDLLAQLAFAPGLLMATLADRPFSLDALRQLATLLTHGLLHLDFMHFALNTGFLLAFGAGVERTYGGGRMLAIFAVSTALGAVGQGVWDSTFRPDVFTVLLGASGGVSGLMGAMVVRLMTDGTSQARRTLGRGLAVVLVVINLVLAVAGSIFAEASVIAWQAHLVGFAGGVAMAMIYRRGRVRQQP